MPLFFLGTREWRNRQTRTVQVRVPVMEWGFNSPLAHDETADPFGICGFCFPWLLLAAPWVFRAPRVLCEAGLLAGPGRCVCRWAAARPRDRHTRACGSEWSISRPALALPPPTGTAARPRHRPSISHVIPLRLVQTLNLRRWNCNVFGVSRKMTTINYVRNLGGGGAGSLIGGWARRLEAWPGPVPRRVPYPQFRMQFPDTCSSSLSEKPGISAITFQSMKCAWGNCMRICADQAPPPPTGTAAWPCRPGGPVV